MLCMSERSFKLFKSNVLFKVENAIILGKVCNLGSIFSRFLEFFIIIFGLCKLNSDCILMNFFGFVIVLPI